MSGRVGGEREGLTSEYLLWYVHKSCDDTFLIFFLYVFTQTLTCMKRMH